MATQEDRLGLRSASERLQDSHSQTNGCSRSQQEGGTWDADFTG